jgi:peptidoglycan/LPS O-acetylase OafA/YrhL
MATTVTSASPATLPDWSVRIPALDGLRGIAILLVLLRHAVFGVSSVQGIEAHSTITSALLAAGQLTWSGVDLFFVLSGFLIGGILLDARQSPRYFPTFYIRRAYRILPLYFLVITLSLLPRLFRTFAHSTPLIPWWSYLTFTQNFWMAALGDFGPSGIGITWSLAIEEQFYVTIPLLIRKIRTRVLLVTLLAVIVGAPLLRLLLHAWVLHPGMASYVLMLTRADALCIGVVLALLVRNETCWNWLQMNRRLLWSATSFLFLGVAFMTWQSYDALSVPMTTWGFTWLAVFYACILLLAISPSGVFPRMLGCAWLMRLGSLAYCSYLIHVGIMQAIRHPLKTHFPQFPVASWLTGGLLGIVLTVIVASISFRYFEKPLLRRGHRYVY